MRRHILLLATALLVVGACGGSEAGDDTDAPGTTGSGAAQAAAVEIRGSAFSPADVTVASGGTVTFTNRDDFDHTVTAGAPDAASGEFDHSLSGADASAEVIFDAPGDYEYFCEIHPRMRGVVTVT